MEECLMDYYTNNLRLLKEKEPELVRCLDGIPPNSLPSTSFDLSRLFPKEIDLSIIDIVVSLGIGGVEYLKAIHNYLPPRIFFLVIEHDLSLFKGLLKSSDLSSLLTSRRVSFAIGEDPFSATRQRLDNYYHIVTFANMHIIEYGPSVSLSPTYYDEIRRMLREVCDVSKRNIATLTDSASLWQHNILTNLPIILRSAGVNTLFNRFNNVPAIIVGAGPSLDSNVKDLIEAKGKALIVAVDTSIKTLYHNGISPDIIVSIDANPANWRDFEGIDTMDAALLTEPLTYPRILSEFKGLTFISSYGHPLMRWIEGIIGEKGYLKVGGSVATTAFDLSRKCGCSPIIFAGLDLAYTKGITHTKAAFEDNLLDGLNKFNTLEMLYRHHLKDSDTILVEGIDGGMVPSSRMMKGWKDWLESQIEEARRYGVTCIDATEGGTKKRGTSPMRLKDAIEAYCKREVDIPGILRDAYSSYRINGQGDLIREIDLLVKEYKAAFEELGEGERLSRRLVWLVNREGLSHNTNRTHHRVQRIYEAVTSKESFMNVSRWSMEPLFFEMKKSKKDSRPETIAGIYHTFFEGAGRIVKEAYREFLLAKERLLLEGGLS